MVTYSNKICQWQNYWCEDVPSFEQTLSSAQLWPSLKSQRLHLPRIGGLNEEAHFRLPVPTQMKIR